MKIIRNFSTTHFLLLYLCVSLFACSCEPDDPQPAESGKLILNFYHRIDGVDIELNTFKYVNEAGNHYLVTDYRYFISDVTLYHSNGNEISINDWKDIHYVDNADTNTLHWQVFDPIPPGDYDSLAFVFGINAAKNQNGLFVNPPEVNMFWPDVLGGGYHYLMLDGKWIDTNNNEAPFNFHSGIGREITSTYTVYHHLNFNVSLASSGFTVPANQTTNFGIQMNIESWFKTPHTWDWNVIGGGIMENYQALKMLTDNGHDVFSVAGR